MTAKYRMPVIFVQNWLTQQSHGLFATAKFLALFSIVLFQSYVSSAMLDNR